MAFTLPANWYRETAQTAVEELRKDLGPLAAASAWRYLYSAVAWAESIGGATYLHLNDRMSTVSGQLQSRRAYDFLKQALTRTKRDPFDVIDYVGHRYDAERVRQGLKPGSWQRNNVTGGAFEATLQVLIHEICGVWPMRTPELNTLRGFELAPAGYHSRPDLALFSPADFRLLISTKWTLRKERIGTYLHEAYFYKQRRPDLQVAFVVSEFNLNILEWLVNDPLVDRVYHIHLPLLLHVHRPFPKLRDGAVVPLADLLKPSAARNSYGRWLALSEKLFDLEQLFADIETLKAVDAGSAQIDPSSPAEPDSDEGQSEHEDAK